MPATPSSLLRRHATLAIIALAAATIAWAPGPRNEGAADRMDCNFNITARNAGSADIWIQFYKSSVRRRSAGITWTRWNDLEIQNHRVAPGATIRRTFTDNGRCDVQRQWRFELRKVTDIYTHSTWTEATTSLNLGDVSRFF